jgi:hypothetical protein
MKLVSENFIIYEEGSENCLQTIINIIIIIIIGGAVLSP